MENSKRKQFFKSAGFKISALLVAALIVSGFAFFNCCSNSAEEAQSEFASSPDEDRFSDYLQAEFGYTAQSEKEIVMFIPVAGCKSSLDKITDFAQKHAKVHGDLIKFVAVSPTKRFWNQSEFASADSPILFDFVDKDESIRQYGLYPDYPIVSFVTENKIEKVEQVTCSSSKEIAMEIGTFLQDQPEMLARKN